MCPYIKLLRILKSGAIVKRLEDAINIDYNLLTLYKFLAGTLIIAHWLACLWQLQTRIIGEKDVGPGGYCPPRHPTHFRPSFPDLNFIL